MGENNHLHIEQKHAYLIMAHNNFKILELLIKALDDKRNDIYLHIDKKSLDFDYRYISSLCKESKIYFTPRINVQWGNFSQIKAELILFKTAITGNYTYYHLISGIDFPIKSQDYIHNFFIQNNGKEFIGFAKYFEITNVSHLHIFNINERNQFKSKTIKRLSRSLQKKVIKLQSLFGYNPVNNFGIPIKKGTNWVSLTHNAVLYLLSQQKTIRKFRFAQFSDEMYKQTVLFSSPLKDNIYNIENEFEGCMRLIDWNRGRPYIFTNQDKEEILKSNKLFCRKFDETTDFQIIGSLYSHIKSSNIE